MSAQSGAFREVVAVFESEDKLQAAIDELLTSSFNRADLSLLASEQAVIEKLGHRYKHVSEIEEAPGIPHAAYVSPEARGDAEGAVIGALMYVGAGVLMGPVAAAGGGIATLIGAAAIGGGVGGALGALLATVLEMDHAERIAEQVKHVGLLLWVRTADKEHETRATEILKRQYGKDVHVHEISASEERA